ncbi:MAG: hypothetical protein WDN45_05910 [Caulobacteraceae bacterium]
MEARLAEACKAARSDWLLVMEASIPAPHGWEGAAGRHMEHHAGRAAYWGRSGLAPFVTPAKAVLIPKKLFDKEAAAPGWLRKLGAKAMGLKIRR